MRMCLSAGKHVLCEKAFTLNAPQAEECIALAREKGLFLMEAMWMRFLPAMAEVRKWVQHGILGDIRMVYADVCTHRPFDPQDRLYNVALGGGALLDLGIYPISLATMVLGFPQRVYSHAHLGPTGVDELDTMTFIYESGATAVLSCSMWLYKPREAFIVGTKGYIKIHNIFFHPDHLTLHLNGTAPREMSYPFSGNGYQYEVEEVLACLYAGATESQMMPLRETVNVMKLMDALRAEWGVVYPGERECL